MTLLEVANLKKIYQTRFKGNKVEALKDVSFSVEEGEYVAIMGESGSGKTTLLNIIALLDDASEGHIRLKNTDLAKMNNKDKAKFRREHLGYIFQDFSLLDNLSIEDNIYLPLVLAGTGYEEMRSRIEPIVKKLGIEKLLNKYPYELSGGQQQRAAVARALITRPDIILADEPTGALDSKSSDELLKYFEDINKEGNTILMVTHSIKAASTASRVLFIKDGKIFHQIFKGDRDNQAMYDEVANTLSMLSRGGE